MSSRMNGSASSMSSKIDEGQHREFVWGCELNKEKPSHLWTQQEEDDDEDYLQHTIFVRQAALGVGAVKEERNIVEMETKTFGGSSIKQTLLSLTAGRQDMCPLDLNFSQDTPVTFRLIEGSGPVFITAQHMVEFPNDDPVDDGGEYTATEAEDEVGGTETSDDAYSPAKAKKRKAGAVNGSKKKRGKLEKSEDDDEEEEEDEDEEDEVEDEEDDDEEMETDDEEEDESEEEEPKGKKGKAKKGQAAGKKGKANGVAKGKEKAKAAKKTKGKAKK